ncbi:hypothetical protein [Photobacterium sp. GB-72]|uniref:hypothetical protein n=1 Tax=Photobacterium sp. GB-72 TaxID=2022105 RepID=UPI000D4E9E92|nr:hypothetical protein [Photobacterium sp. GB-72]PSV27622.1 hypothetical protein C9J40_20010 [Photobacterium sp. GB-72]
MEFFQIANDMRIKSKSSTNAVDIKDYCRLEKEYAELGFNKLRSDINQFNKVRYRNTIDDVVINHIDSYKDAFSIYFKTASRTVEPKISNCCLNYYAVLFNALASGVETEYQLTGFDIDLLKLYWIHCSVEAIKNNGYTTNDLVINQLSKMMKYEIASPAYHHCRTILENFERSKLEAAMYVPLVSSDKGGLI